MLLPWKLLKIKGIWIVLSTIGFVIYIFNFTTLSVPDLNSFNSNSDQLPWRPEVHTKFKRQGPRKFPPRARAVNRPTMHAGNSKMTSPATPKPEVFIHPKREVQHIAFLKVHKAASSTAQNIFLRFGWDRNLTFVLSPAKNPSGYPNIISLRESLTNSNILPPPPNKHYDILCNHVFYTNEAFTHFMPKDTVFIGIVREPFDLYKSILNYFRPRYIFKKIQADHPASEFLRHPEKYEPKGKASSSWTNSRMAVEFGFPPHVFKMYHKKKVGDYLVKLSKEFRIVLVAELMEESVVLMRRYLHWQTKDILFLNLNVAKRKNETMLSQPFDRDMYKNHSKVDYALYNFFYKRLKEQIRHEGPDYDDEILAFKELRKRIGEYCAQTQVTTPMVVRKTRWGRSFSVSKPDCANMKRGEIDFITRIRIRQYGSKDI